MYYCDDLELKAIEKVLKRKKLFRYQGKNIESECFLFEKKFAHYLGTQHSILLSSGTNALVNALFTLGVSEGDEVLIPAYTFFATIAAVCELKAVPVIINIDEYLSFDQQDLIKKVTSKTKAIIAVHMDGYACDMDYLDKFCKEHSLYLIEDVAQSIGGSFKNKKLGTIGDMGCFSFNEDKIISCGEGGAVCVNDELLYQKAFLYHDTCNQFGPTMKDQYTIEKFSGKSMRVSEIQGAMINVQLDRLNDILKNLRERKQILINHLETIGLKLLPTHDQEGECSTTARVFCDDIKMVNKLFVEINQLGIKSYTPMLRPAHHVWQWHSLIPQTQIKADFLTSIEILSRALLIYVSLEGSLDQWKDLVKKIQL